VDARDAATDSRRQLLLDLLRGALDSVDGRLCVKQALAARRFDKPVHAFAIGKAACAMAEGASDALGAQLQSIFIATKEGHVSARIRRAATLHSAAQSCASDRPIERPAHSQKSGSTTVFERTRAPDLSDWLTSAQALEIFESGHPVPDERSLAAGEQLIRRVTGLPEHLYPLFLISGGSSSIVEALIPGVSLSDLVKLNTHGLAHGLDIEALNERRRTISRIKGGRLAGMLQGRAATALFISDVPTDDPAIIGSGLLGPAPEAPDCVERSVIASIDNAVTAVSEAANRLGLRVRTDHTRFASEADRLAVRFAHELRIQTEQLAVWGGESVMNLPESPGSGGRNQHLALAAARLIAGHDDLLLLAIGTDGTDGPTDDAGALVDGDTCARLVLGEMDIDDCLRRADSGTALAMTGDLLHTGPTGTNVGDLVIGLKLPRAVGDSLSRSRGGDLSRVL